MKINQLTKVAIVTLTFTSVGFVHSKTHRQAQAQTCVTPPSGLVAWWPGDGNTLDYQGDSNGTLQNGATFAPGMVGQAFSFDGVDDDVMIPSSPILNVGTANGLTIDAWINPSTTDGSQRPIMEWNNGSTYGVHFWMSVTSQGGVPNNLLANLVDAAGNWHIIQSATAVINPNTYQHVALTYDKSSGAAVLYWNGTVVGQANLGVFTPQTTYDLYFAKRVTGSAAGTAYAGAIDEMELFNRALSQSEVQAIFNAGSAGKCKPPLVIRPTSLPDGAIGSPYNQTITAGAGTGPYSFTVTSGSLSTGLSLSNGGSLSGTPQTTGSFNFTVQATDSNNVTAHRAYSMSIVPGCIAPPSDLVGWYPGDGNAVDIQSGNNGSLQGGATFAPGKVGQAFSLNGSSAYVQAAAISAQDPTTAGSLDAWVYLNQLPSQVGHAMAIIVKGGSGTDFNLQVFNNGGDRFFLQVAANTNVPSTTIVQTGQWYHVAGTWDSSVGLKIYVNGQLENTNSTLTTRGQSGQPFTIGNDLVFGPRLFNGLIDEAQIFDRALTASEVQAIFNAGIAGQCKSPSPNFCGVISGKITDAQGALAGALVQACEPNNGPCSFNATTDASGNYQISGLPVSTPFDLTVFPPQGSVDVPGELLGRSVAACGTPLASQDVMLQAPAPPAQGTSIQPNRNGGGGVPAVYWQSPLTLTTTGCQSGTASYIISRGSASFASGSMTETPAGSGTYTASVPQLSPAHGAATVSMTIQCGGGGSSTTGFNIYIDPSGIVKTSGGAPVSGATMTLLRSDTANGTFTVVPDGSAVMSPGNRHNPDTTDAAGNFGWDVLAGFYKVRAETAGCLVESGVLQIPPPVTDLVLTLDCPVQLIGAVCPKTHSSAGTWPLGLSLGNPPTVESRTGGPGGNHTLVLSFATTLVNVDSVNASATSPSGPQPVTVSSSSGIGPDPRSYTVNVSGVPNAQYLTVTLNGVHDNTGQVSTTVSVSMGVLLGDVNGDGGVSNLDVSLVKAKVAAGASVDGSNFRKDVNADGGFSNLDISITKGQVAAGAQLPTPP